MLSSLATSFPRKVILLWLVLTLVRVFYTLQLEPVSNEMERQVYLPGLKFYTTGEWPFFGEQQVIEGQYTEVQEGIKEVPPKIPGALLGLLVGVPLYLMGVSEAPTIFLAILMSFSLGMFAWYLTRKNFKIPTEWIWAWTLTIPLTIKLGIRLTSWSYLLVFSFLIFIPLIELLPLHSKRILPKRVCFFLIGLLLLLMAQLHLAWLLLLPITLYVFLIKQNWRDLKLFLYFLAGGLLGSITVLPTLVMYPGAVSDLGKVFDLNAMHADKIIDILVKIFLLPSFEVNYDSTLLSSFSEKIKLAVEIEWTFPIVIIMAVVGWLQIFVYVICILFPTGFDNRSWDRSRFLIIWICLLVVVGYFFHREINIYQSHLVVLPVAYFYSMFVNEWLLETRPWSKYVFFVAFITVLIYFLALGLDSQTKELNQENPYRVSLDQAMKTKDYRILEELENLEIK